jgi:hypothetical protein
VTIPAGAPEVQGGVEHGKIAVMERKHVHGILHIELAFKFKSRKELVIAASTPPLQIDPKPLDPLIVG